MGAVVESRLGRGVWKKVYEMIVGDAGFAHAVGKCRLLCVHFWDARNV